MSIKIALAGNPNSGKTTLFNALTGSNQFVGNWPGVTVEKKEGKLKGYKDVYVADLPGIYSLSPYTLEEVVARDYLIGERPDVILNIVDGTNIERNLFLTTQLLELGIPVVVAINMMDIVKKRGDTIDISALSKALGCKVVEISALKGTGVKEAADMAVLAAERKVSDIPVHRFSNVVEIAIENIATLVDGISETQRRFFAIKVFERDEKIRDKVKVPSGVEHIISAVEDALDDDSESIITDERYKYISSVLKSCYIKKDKGVITTSDKIDRVVTNRFLALPIFAVVMFIVYFVSVTTVGSWATDWANDGVFGDGWHFLGIGAAEYKSATGDFEIEQVRLGAFIDAAGEAGIDTAPVTEAIGLDPEAYGGEAEAEAARNKAAANIAEFIEKAGGITAYLELERDDGTVESLTVTAAEFEAALEVGEPDPADFGIFIPGIPVIVEAGLETAGTVEWLNGLILDGIIGGVGAVLGFVPQILVLFMFLAFLEACGYMARIAFITDRIFRRFGLTGKLFIPILIGSGCGIPGIMASRTIENDRDRRMTIMTTTFMPCGAKLPVIALISGALFGGAWWVAPSAYFAGVAAIISSGIILKKTRLFSGDPAPFVMELPAYHLPTAVNVLRSMWERSWSFIKKAGTIILLSAVAVWFLSNFGIVDGEFVMVDDLSDGFLSVFGSAIAWVFAPLGFGHWEAAVATLTGLVAKENVVSTLGVLYGMAEVAEDGAEIWGSLAASFTAAGAFSFLLFNLLCAPCFAAIGAIRCEMNSAKWAWLAVGYQTGLAYAVAFVINKFGILAAGGIFGAGAIAAVFIVAGFVFLLVRPDKKVKTASDIEREKVAA